MRGSVLTWWTRLLPVGLLLLCASCAGDTGTRFEGAPVIVVSIDTLRSDRLPCYGYGGVETPWIDRLAADSLLYERAYTAYPLTLPAHATLFTGQLPPRHGVRNNVGFELPDEQTTLAERLSAAGYQTGGAVSSMVLRRGSGIAQGFESWNDDMRGGRPATALRKFAERPGGMTVEAALAQLEQMPAEQPFFLFLHLFEPHTPYDPPEPYLSRFPSPYDGEIAYADEIVGRLVEALRERDLYERSVLVLLGDHGEGLGDHVEQEHGFLLYRETLQVPLLIKLPGNERAGQRIADPVGLVDVTPTLLTLVGLDPGDTDGTALFPQPAPDRELYAETWFGSYQWGWSPMRSMIRGTMHYIEAPRSELYDLERDPSERDNLLPGRNAPEDLLGALASIERGGSAVKTISEEERRQLASLGYVGGGPEPPPDGPDPKDRIGLVVELWEQLERVGRTESTAPERRALALMGELELQNETLAVTLANNLLQAGRPGAAEEALAPFAESGRIETLRLLGEAAAAAGRAEAALARFRRVLELQPDDARALLGVGMTLLGAGRLTEARAPLERAMEIDPGLVEGWNASGALALQTGDAATAVRTLEQAVRLDPGFGDAWFNLALAYRELGDETSARRAHERWTRINRHPAR